MGGEKSAFWNVEVSEATPKNSDLTPRQTFEDLKSKVGDACTCLLWNIPFPSLRSRVSSQ